MARPVTVWGKTRKILGGCVILAFLFPFFAVSCDGMDVVTISGTDMVIGAEPGGLAAELKQDRPGRASSDKSGVSTKLERVEVEPFAIAALAIAVLVFGLTWLPSRSAALGSIAASIAGVGMLIALWITMQQKLNAAVEDSKTHKGALERNVVIDAGPRPGLFGAALGLIALAVFSGLALRPQRISPQTAPPA